MSRIGRLPISLPSGVELTQEGSRLRVKGPLGTLEREIHPEISIERADGEIRVVRPSDQPRHRALHGLTRTLINNMVTGVTSGFSKGLEISGVGYRAQLQGTKLVLALGYSHPVEVEAALAGALGERANPPVVLVTAAVEDHGLDAGRLRPLGKRLAHGARGVDLAVAVRDPRLAARGRGQGPTAGIVDDLRVDELRRAEDRQARTLGGALQPQPEPLVSLATQRVATLLLDHAAPPTLPALPALRRICSPA